MVQELFSEINALYASNKENPNVILIKIQMQDSIDEVVLRRAVDKTMERYPYFKVELKNMDGQYVFESNNRPIVIADSDTGIELNSEASNYHMLAFSRYEDFILLCISHALTDGTGAYEITRTLLYYYCSDYYKAALDSKGIRLAGENIPKEEWDNPAKGLPDTSSSGGGEILPSINPLQEMGEDEKRTAFGISIDESEFMRFSSANDGSPGTLAALFLSRAIADVHPDKKDPIRISMCVNQRKGLKAPYAHQCLVGGTWLEYKDKMRGWSLDKQATCYRGMVFAQTRDEAVLSTQSSINNFTKKLLSLDTDKERAEAAEANSMSLKNVLSATVSYVGKANFGDAEKYIKSFHMWATPMNENILLEISAVNKTVTIEFIQNFSNPVYFNAFLSQLFENGIVYRREYKKEFVLPNMSLPWEI